MKKFYIPILALLIAFGGSGCEKKTENAAVDSSVSTSQKMEVKTEASTPKKLTNPNTTKIMPPAAASSGNLVVTLPQGGNSADFYVFFVVSPTSGVTQTVNIGSNGPYTSGTRTGPPSGMIGALQISAPATVTVTATLSSGTYSASSIPVNSNVIQLDGWDVTTFDDGNGNKAIIAVMDIGE
jgi:hypothetical protein